MSILDRCESRKGKVVRLLAIHSSEGDGTAAQLRDAAWWKGSSHAIADERTLLTPAEGCVPYATAAWTLRSGNPISENIELVGWAKWTRADWLARPGLLENCARWLAERSVARGIPLVKLTAADILAGKAGVIGHVDWTRTGDGDHTDPGPGFPFDSVLARARELTTPEDDMKIDELFAARDLAGRNWIDFQNFATSVFGELTKRVDDHAAATVANLDYDLLAQKLADLLATRLTN